MKDIGRGCICEEVGNWERKKNKVNKREVGQKRRNFSVSKQIQTQKEESLARGNRK